MKWSVLPFAGFLFFLICASGAETGWNGGVDLILEAASGTRGAAGRGSSFEGEAVGHLGWNQAKNSDAGDFRWEGYGRMVSLVGHGPSARFLGDFLGASDIEDCPGTRLYSLWLQAGRGNWSIRAGVLVVDEEFAGTTMGGNFLNSGFSWPAFISANTVDTGPLFFGAAPGVRLERQCSEATAWRLGLYDGEFFDSPIGHPLAEGRGWRDRLRGNQGAFVITEVAYASPASASSFKLGGWLHTARFPDMCHDDSGGFFAKTGAAPHSHSCDYGIYALAECTLAGKSGIAGHIGFFMRGGISPADRNLVAWAVDSGLAWTGPLPGRSADILALGVVHAAFGSPFAADAFAVDSSSAVPDFERVIEASYRIVLSERFNIQPDVQYIRHPGGSAAQKRAVVLLLRFNAAL